MADRKPTMSMEAYLDEERLEVLALLTTKTARSPSSASSLNGRSSSPYMTTRSPIRSMLDIGDDPKSPPRQPHIRSMLDIDEGVTSSSLAVQSSPNSPVVDQGSISSNSSKGHHPRSFSDASGVRPMDSTVRTGLPKVTDVGPDPYQFGGLITSHSMPAMPKRNTQGGRRSTGGLSAESQARANELGIVDRGRQFIKNTTLSGTRSPQTRSRSPFGRSSVGNLSSNMAVLDDGTTININNAYRQLSDAKLAISGGSLSQLAHRKRAEDKSGRLTKDWIHEDGEYEDSSEDEPSTSDDEQRGRKKTTRGDDRKPAQSLLGAAEEERIQVAGTPTTPKYQYRSLFDEPKITITNPSGEKKASKVEIHPSTSFEPGLGSGNVSGVDSDDAADVDDIHRAQKLSISMTPILTRPDAHRAIRILYRGEYHKVVQAAEDEHRRLRKYVVATDLSEESTHALEWAIGTVLRDGDTLICIYCVDEETGIGASTEGQVPDDPRAMREVAAAVNALTLTKAPPTSTTMVPFPQIVRAGPLHTAPDRVESPAGGTSRERTRAEDERSRAVQAITDKVVKLLRKTRLQVRVTIEVLHCKNPKHLITEVIDITCPTLVILGSRGRSALKGVILGSFSNYLVTKSSAPVMVARKRLRKTKYKTKPQAQVNNLSGPAARKLANAKVD